MEVTSTNFSLQLQLTYHDCNLLHSNLKEFLIETFCKLLVCDLSKNFLASWISDNVSKEKFPDLWKLFAVEILRIKKINSTFRVICGFFGRRLELDLFLMKFICPTSIKEGKTVIQLSNVLPRMRNLKIFEDIMEGWVIKLKKFVTLSTKSVSVLNKI